MPSVQLSPVCHGAGGFDDTYFREAFDINEKQEGGARAKLRRVATVFVRKARLPRPFVLAALYCAAATKFAAQFVLVDLLRSTWQGQRRAPFIEQQQQQPPIFRFPDREARGRLRAEALGSYHVPAALLLGVGVGVAYQWKMRENPRRFSTASVLLADDARNYKWKRPSFIGRPQWGQSRHSWEQKLFAERQRISYAKFFEYSVDGKPYHV